MIHRELYFATPVYIKDIGTPEYNKYLEEKIVNWSKNDEGLKKTNMYGWHSTTDMHNKTCKEYSVTLFRSHNLTWSS